MEWQTFFKKVRFIYFTVETSWTRREKNPVCAECFAEDAERRRPPGTAATVK